MEIISANTGKVIKFDAVSSNVLHRVEDFRYNTRMNAPLKVTKIGNSAGVILPKEVLAHLNAQVGSRLNFVRTSRGIEVSMLDPEFGEQVEVAAEVMERRHKAMMALANEIMDQDRAILAALAKK